MRFNHLVMPLLAASLLAAGVGQLGCSTPRSAEQAREPGGTMNPSISISKENLGKRIIIEGWAADAKSGALVLGERFSIFIHKLDSWPDGYYSGGQKGKRVRVSGILGEAHDLPVFVPPADGLPRTGIPVRAGADLRSASQRFVVKEAKWELLE